MPDIGQTVNRSRAINAVCGQDIRVENADYWRARAEEARRRSEQVLDSITKALLLEIADTHERIAKAYEERPSTFPRRDR